MNRLKVRSAFVPSPPLWGDPETAVRTYRVFEHSADIPLRSHIHPGMFAFKMTFLENSEGTEQSNIKSWAVLQ